MLENDYPGQAIDDVMLADRCAELMESEWDKQRRRAQSVVEPDTMTETERAAWWLRFRRNERGGCDL